MDVVDYLQQLIALASPSHQSNLAIADWVERELERLGFAIERIEYDDIHGVRKANILGKKGQGTGGLAWFGHTDVVPADNWRDPRHGPFEPHLRDGRLYGRGACDMKGSIACMLAAVARFPADRLRQPIYLVCTADEEVGYGGARRVVARSQLYRELVAGGSRAVIGEPTRLEVVYAHKGTCSLIVTSPGRAAHSSTREGINANLAMIPFLAEMKAIHDQTEHDPAWRNDEFDPPTISWNIGINDHTSAANITPAQSVCTILFRPMPGRSCDPLLERVRAAAGRYGLEMRIQSSCPPLHVDPQSPFIRDMLRLAGKETPRTVCYGTDGGVLEELQDRVVCGPGDIAQAHTHQEWIELDQLERGTQLYGRLIEHWCGFSKPATRDAPPPNQPAAPAAERFSFSTRSAQPGDLPQIRTLVQPYVQRQMLLSRTDEELLKLIENGFVAEHRGGVVGFVALEIYSKKMAELECLAVAEALHGRGIGRRLIECCVQRARELKVYEVMTITASDELFQACGFHYALPDQKRALFIHTGNVRTAPPGGG